MVEGEGTEASIDERLSELSLSIERIKEGLGPKK